MCKNKFIFHLVSSRPVSKRAAPEHQTSPSRLHGDMRTHAPAPVRQDGTKVLVTTVTDKTGGSGKRARKTKQKHLGTVYECCGEQWKVKLDQCDESKECKGCEGCVFLVSSSSDSW
jgi:hypothetical protein